MVNRFKRQPFLADNLALKFRFASLFNSYVGLQSALEDARNLLMIGADCRGIAPLRAALEWTPVQAHSTAHRVNLFYAAKSATSAAYLKDW